LGHRAIVAGTLVSMSTPLVAIVIALVGIAGVLLVSYAFYVVGRAEDRERAAARRSEPEPEPEPEPDAAAEPPQPHGPGSLARSRARRPRPRRPS
jgi:hypothetical protein